MRTDVPGATSCVQYRSATGVAHLFGQGLHHCSAQRIGTVPLSRKVGVAFGEPVVVVAGVGPRSIHGYQSALLQGLGKASLSCHRQGSEELVHRGSGMLKAWEFNSVPWWCGS